MTRATSPIKVDGVLDEEAWKTAAVVPVNNEWLPGDNIPAPVETQCLVTYDARNLYVAFRALDPKPGDIRAHLMDRDDTDTLIQDDHIGADDRHVQRRAAGLPVPRQPARRPGRRRSSASRTASRTSPGT